MAIAARTSEEAICRLWEAQRFRTTALASTDGVAVQCIFRGRRRRTGGPDFVDALLSFDGADLRRGDVEVHVRSADWFAHRHHLDHAYDRVILHVVLHHDGTPSTTAGGHIVPTLALDSYLVETVAADGAPAEPGWVKPWPCADLLQRRGIGYLGFVLDRAGRQRLIERAARFEAGFACVGREQTLYSALLEALGYSANREPFRHVASCLPWRDLENVMLSQPAELRPTLAEALLFGVARRLPSQQAKQRAYPAEDSAYASSLEGLWQGYASTWGGVPGDLLWRHSGLRPSNHPDRRLAAGAHYLAAVLPTGLIESLESLAHQVPPGRLPLALRHHFTTATLANHYWATRYSFGCPLGAPRPHLIGVERAGDIAISVVLPFLLASANANAGAYTDAVLEAYRLHPKLAENEITRSMASLLTEGRGPFVARSAQQQQGLLHLYNRFCRDQRCDECPLA